MLTSLRLPVLPSTRSSKNSPPQAKASSLLHQPSAPCTLFKQGLQLRSLRAKPLVVSVKRKSTKRTGALRHAIVAAGSAPTVEDSFIGGDTSTRLYRCAWIPENVKAQMTIVHGFGEHINRYNNLEMIEKLNAAGVAVFGLDLQGHGKSEGEAGMVEELRLLTLNIERTAQWAKEQCPDVPSIIFGHSMGGAAVGLVVLEYPQVADLVVMSSASVKIADDMSPIEQKLASFISKVVPSMGLVPLDATQLSHDIEVQQAYTSDGLNFKNKVPAVSCVSIMSAEKLVLARAAEVKAPILIMHGTKDSICDPQGSELMYAGVSSTDKTLKMYPGLYHEIFNESLSDRTQVLDDLIQWIEERL